MPLGGTETELKPPEGRALAGCLPPSLRVRGCWLPAAASACACAAGRRRKDLWEEEAGQRGEEWKEQRETERQRATASLLVLQLHLHLHVASSATHRGVVTYP